MLLQVLASHHPNAKDRSALKAAQGHRQSRQRRTRNIQPAPNKPPAIRAIRHLRLQACSLDTTVSPIQLPTKVLMPIRIHNNHSSTR